jgi:phosphoserine phosphatase
VNQRGNFTGLILLTGKDRPGIFQSLLDALKDFSISIIDIEQVVIRGRLILTVLISLDPAHKAAIVNDLEKVEQKLNVDIAVDFTDEPREEPTPVQAHVVLIGQRITPKSVNDLAKAILSFGANIDGIKRNSREPVTAIEFDLSSTTPIAIQSLQRQLVEVAGKFGLDLAVQAAGLTRRAKRLVIMDMDSTLIQQEVIDLLAVHAGKSNEVKEITELAMNGEIEFKEALAKRVQLLAGLPETIFEKVRSELTLSPGAESLIETLHKIGHKVGVVSGGFIEVIEPLLKKLNIDYSKANSLEIVNGKLTGKLVGAVVDRLGKQKALEEFAAREKIPLEQTVAIGDGANDIDMLATAGLGVAYNAKPSVREAADVMITTPHLDTVLYLMGIGDFAN